MLLNQKPYYIYMRELCFCLLYFFFNGLFLPEGLYYTTLLSPVFLAYVVYKGYYKALSWFIVLSIPLFFIHYMHGIHVRYYMISWLLLFSCYIFILTAYDFVKHAQYLDRVFSRVLYINMLLVGVAVLAYFIPALFDSFWYVNNFTQGASTFARLKMFTTEASHYAIIFAPVAIYYLLKAWKRGTPHVSFLLVFSLVPLLLSFSFGVIFAMLLAFFIMMVIESQRLPAYKKRLLGMLVIGAACSVLFLLFASYMPEHPIVVRLKNIFSNNDTSFKGRTIDSFILSYDMANMKSLWFGMGPGQVKVYGLELYDHFYNLPVDPSRIIRIPNAIGETMAIYGILGLMARFGILAYCYFKTKVYSNYYRQALFIFLFIYQFSGSNIVSINEYVIWILAFSATQFHEFDKTNTLTRS